MAESEQNGIHLWRRALVVGVLGLFTFVIAELALGVAYGSWWSELQLQMLLVEIGCLLIWAIIDPRTAGRLVVKVALMPGKASRWSDSIGNPTSTYGARHIASNDGSVPPGHTLSNARSESRSPVVLRPFLALTQWYERPRSNEERAVRWVLLWLLVATTVYMMSALIRATGGATTSPFMQLPFLGFVLAGTFSDSRYHPRLIVFLGIVFALALGWQAAILTPFAEFSVPGANDVEKQRLAYSIVTPVTTAMGVWQSYSAMSLRRWYLSHSTPIGIPRSGDESGDAGNT